MEGMDRMSSTLRIVGQLDGDRQSTCTYHCAEHFTSLEAFDLHRSGDYAVRRHCIPPAEILGLIVGSEHGRCNISGEHNGGRVRSLHGVTLYVAGRLVGRRAAYAATRVEPGAVSLAVTLYGDPGGGDVETVEEAA